LRASSTNWLEAALEIRDQVISKLGLGPEQREDETITRSPEAWELFSRACVGNREGQPLSDGETDLRKALVIDPGFALARQVLAYLCMLQGRSDEALDLAKQAARERPHSWSVHYTLGTIYLTEGLAYLARGEFILAISEDPDRAEAYVRLSEIYAAQRKFADAVSILEKAKRIAPYDVPVHIALGRTYAQLQDSEKALAELDLAAKYDTGLDAGMEEALGDSYAMLSEVPRAVEYFQRFLALAEKAALPPAKTDRARTTLAELKARLQVHFVDPPSAKDLGARDLEQSLRQRLTEDERQLVSNPLAATEEMERWSKRVCAGAQTPLDRAERLFHALARHINPERSRTSGRTAVKAFADLADPDAQITCDDYTRLYVALGRRVGLTTCYVYVEKDYRGKCVSHSCAGVAIDGKWILADPAYRWFGVPHKKYQFESDLDAVAAFLAQSQDSRREDVSLKLVPDRSIPFFCVAVARAMRREWRRASEALRMGMELGPRDWRGYYAQGLINAAQKDWDSAARSFRQCLSINSELSEAHYSLGTVLAAQGRLNDAREEYRGYLREDTKPDLAEKARDAILYINETIGSTE
jgi:tetratricopeptide (TPR) repeat protein